METQDFWFAHVKSYQSKNVSRVEYCRTNTLNYPQFTYWLKKYTKESSPLLAVKLKRESPALKNSLCTLHFKNGSVLEIHYTSALTFILERLS